VPRPELAAQAGAARFGDGVRPSHYPVPGFDRSEMFHVEPPRGIVPGSTLMLAAARRRQCRPGNMTLSGLKRRGLAYQRCR